ncbi:hypothetical protein [Microbulbifer discodermiae]|uniref:hypothetical protein n=1 Tax=Microbulbifer sp. 2201CG32-9 TaxID=3232309 RepID=UPI00345C4E5D
MITEKEFISMSECGTQPAKVPTAEIILAKQRRESLLRELDDTRLALCALNPDASGEAQLALLHLIDERLKLLVAEAEADLSDEPDKFQS